MKFCEPGIYEILKLIAGGAVYPKRAPQGATGPYVIYQRVDGERWRSINGPSGTAQAFIQVDTYAPRFYQAKKIASDIEAILDGYRGTVAVPAGDYYAAHDLEISGISLQSEVDFEDKTDVPTLFRDSKTYLVTYKTG